MQLNSHKILNEKNILWVIILTGSLLRLYQADSIPFTHDELSAIRRLNFNNLSDLIEYGVKVDEHPALIQVFLYYWTSLFGVKELVLKLPFLMMGIASIPISYILTKKWFNPTSALFVAGFMATLQFPIMFSQIARPYISGMFFILLLSYNWTEYLFNPKHSNWSLFGIIVFASLSTYNHYFSFMMAGIIGLTGFFFLSSKTIKGYLFAFLAVAMAFIPHLSIFFYQLNIEGLEWLGAPTTIFFVNHIKFIFHFSILIYLLVFGLSIFGIWQSKKVFINKFQWISLTWFVTPIIIGLTYSIMVKPVIQFSMLIFSFPFLIIFLFSWIKPLNNALTSLLVIIILSMNCFTLIQSREHYKVYYSQPISEFSNLTSNFLKGKFTENIPKKFDIFYGDEPRYLDFYFSTQNPGISFHPYSQKEFNAIEFKNEISKSDLNYLIIGNIDPSLVLLAQEVFTNTIHIKKGLNHTYYILGKPGFKGHSKPEHPVYKSILSFDIQNNDWPNYRKELELGNYILRMDSTEEWGPNLKLNLDELINSRHHLVQVKLDFKSNTIPTGLIVISVNRNDTQLSWSSISLKEYYSTQDSNQWKRAFFSVNLTDVLQDNNQLDGAVLSINYWNKGLNPIVIDNFEVKLTKGNPYLYSTVQPIN